jgi:hypothetical protein
MERWVRREEEWGKQGEWGKQRSGGSRGSLTLAESN